MPTPKLTPQIINAAILGFEEQKRHIDTQIAELRAMLPGDRTEPAVTPEAPIRKRRKFSAAARRRMKEAQQLRWAEIRGESEPSAPATSEPSKPKRKLSKAGKAAIVAATKARWERVRAEAANAKPAAKKQAVKKAPVKAAKKRAPIKKTVVKKSATKKPAPAAAQVVPQAAAQ
jgi:DnaK suppressor protein